MVKIIIENQKKEYKRPNTKDSQMFVSPINGELMYGNYLKSSGRYSPIIVGIGLGLFGTKEIPVILTTANV